MPLRLEDYAMIGDTETAALVGRDGSVDWLCAPRFPDEAVFAALLGDREHGRWLLAPEAGGCCTRRCYRDESLVLESTWDTPEGTVRVIDLMPIRHGTADVVRIVEGVSGRVPMRLDLIIRFDYGHVAPWVRCEGRRMTAIAGADAMRLASDVDLEHADRCVRARFEVAAGDRAEFVLTWHPSHERLAVHQDAGRLLDGTMDWWRRWADCGSYDAEWEEEVRGSLVVLKGLTFDPTGGIVAAPTTSLPEHIGGVRNWDYRACWVRDATLTLQAFLIGGYTHEAAAWRDWLLRAVAGEPQDLQIMYGIGGERELFERELPWLPGYCDSAPVRIGNAASRQFQLDVPGELMDSLHLARQAGMDPNPDAWKLQRELLDFLQRAWRQPDSGIWEVRGPERHFTHSKVMAWVAFDRAVQAVERLGLDGPVDRWRRCREEIRAEVLERGFDADRGAFTQTYDGEDLDAALLMIPLVGFLPADDERVRGTVDAIQRDLCSDGLVLRYRTRKDVDGLPEGEGAFLACSFWLADNLALMGRRDEAVALFERLLSLRNDVGLLAEEYDPVAGRMLGNFPQAFSHVSLITSARNLSRRPGGPAEERRRSDEQPSGQ